jgi:hypothetical protein
MIHAAKMLLRFFLVVALWRLAKGGSVDYQRNDGWYNNLPNPTWGATDTQLKRKLTPRYDDATYKMSMRNRPNPRDVSNHVFSGADGTPSGMNRTALFAFFSR